MSKMLKDLSRVMEVRGKKYQLALESQGATASTASEQKVFPAKAQENPRDLNNNVITLSKNVFYLFLGVLVFFSLVSLILSFNAVSKIQSKNIEAVQLNNLIGQQNEEIKSLKAYVEVSKELQSQETKDLRMIVKGLSGAHDYGAKELNELKAYTEDLESALIGLKTTNRKLLNGYINLKEEVRRLRIFVTE